MLSSFAARSAIALSALICMAPAPAESPAARVAKSSSPIEMTSRGGLNVDLKKQIGVAKGDVVIRRDDITVCCDEAEARYSGDRVERVECRGRVVIVRADGTRALADVAVFEAAKDRLTLSGAKGARVAAPEADLHGDVIVYDIATDRLEVQGKKSQFRYRPTSGEGAAPPLELPRSCPPPQ